MSIDGINRGITFPGQTDTGKPQGAGAAMGAKGYEEIDLIQLLQAQTQGTGDGNKTQASLPPPPSGGSKKTEETLASMAVMSDSQVSADIFAFMALFQKLAQQMRDTARTQRTSEMQAQVTALQSAAEKMKDAAAQRLTAAIVQGAMQIAGGVMQMGLSAASAKETIKGAKMEAQGKDMLSEVKLGTERGTMGPGLANWGTKQGNSMVSQGQQLGAAGTKYQGLAQASSGITAGLGGIIGATFTHKADLIDAEKTNLETQAKVHETGVQHANDMMQQMMDVIRDVRDKLQSIQQASIETNRGIARNI